MMVWHPVLLGLSPPGGAEAEQAGGDDAELEENDCGTSGDDDRPGGAHNFFIPFGSPDEN